MPRISPRLTLYLLLAALSTAVAPLFDVLGRTSFTVLAVSSSLLGATTALRIIRTGGVDTIPIVPCIVSFFVMAGITWYTLAQALEATETVFWYYYYAAITVLAIPGLVLALMAAARRHRELTATDSVLYVCTFSGFLTIGLFEGWGLLQGLLSL